MKRQLSSREWVLLGLLAVILLASAYIPLFYTPTTEERDNCLSEAEACRTETEAFQARLEEKLRMEREMEEQEANGTPLRSVPDYDNFQPVIFELNNILAGTDNYTLSFGSVDDTQTIVRRSITLSYSAGSYDAAKAVLRMLHDCAYRCMLGDLNLGFGGGEEAGGVSVTGSIVFFEYQEGLSGLAGVETEGAS